MTEELCRRIGPMNWLSSSDDLVEEDTAVSTLRVVRAFSTLDKECGLDVGTLSRFRDQF